MPVNWIEKYPKAVALSLLGVLVAWAVASGLWIYSLRAAIHRQEAALEAGEVKAKEDRQLSQAVGQLERKEIRLNQREQRLKMAGPRPGTAAGRG